MTELWTFGDTVHLGGTLLEEGTLTAKRARKPLAGAGVVVRVDGRTAGSGLGCTRGMVPEGYTEKRVHGPTRACTGPNSARTCLVS